MAKLSIRLSTDGATIKVSEMRRRLAKSLSHLHGDQDISYTFTAMIEAYVPVRPESQVHIGSLARPEND